MIRSDSKERDGRLWRHVSISKMGDPDRVPSWADLRYVRDCFIGGRRKAIQVLPSDREYVNIHPGVLHLFASLEDDPLPDFCPEAGML